MYIQLFTKTLFVTEKKKSSIMKLTLLIYTMEHPPKRVLYSYKKQELS